MEHLNLLSIEDLNTAILEVLSAKKVLNIPIYPTTVVFNQPTAKQKLLVNLQETLKIDEYIKSGYISETDIFLEEVRDNIFSVEEEEELKDIISKIKGYEAILRKRLKSSTQYPIEVNKLNELRIERDILLNKKNSINLFTAEYKAREDKYITLMSLCVTDLDEKLIWNTVEDLLNSTIYTMGEVYSSLNDYLTFYFGHELSSLRQIARSHQWTTYYKGSKSGLFDLFDRKGKDLSFDQINLTVWSQFYENIEELPYKDRPSQEVIDDDDKLDAYLKEYNRRTVSELGIQNKSKAMDNQHVVVNASADNYINLHKAGMYSDPEIIKGRVPESSTKYSEKDQITKIKRGRN